MQATDKSLDTGSRSAYLGHLRDRLAGTKAAADPLAAEYRGAYRDLPPEFRPDRDLVTRVAAVLIPVVKRTPVPTVLFTRRTEHLLDHAGQVSFPGGSREPADANAVATALRETHEELGLGAERVETIGFLAPYRTTTGFVITPVVGLVEPGPLAPNPDEVAAAFEVPLDYLLESSRFERHEKNFHGHRVAYYVVRYRDETIWGATAAILYEFCSLFSSDKRS